MNAVATETVNAKVRTDIQQLVDGPFAAPSKRFTPGEYLTLRLGNEEYAIGILNVQEIRSYKQPTRIANAPEHIKGVIDLRGVIVPIVDLRVRFGAAQAVYNDFTVVVIVNVGEHLFGIVLDAVCDVQCFDDGNVKPAPDFHSETDTGYILGLGNLQDRMVILIDIERLLTSPDLGLVGMRARHQAS